MPLYDCVLLLKPQLTRESMIDLLVRVGKHVYARNGVVTEMKSLGVAQLGYGIKKLDGKYFQGKIMQMTMMATPNISKELHYLNKDDRLLRWLLVKHRDVKYGHEYFSDGYANGEDSQPSVFDDIDMDEKDTDVDEDEDEDDVEGDEYLGEAESKEIKT